jgi:uncharacterized protein YdhG (YjbR/CyaY superfamily)
VNGGNGCFKKTDPFLDIFNTSDKTPIEALYPLANMKEASSGSRRPLKKAIGTPKTIDEYLSRIPGPTRSTLRKVRAAIRSAVPPEATETISYRIPAFRYNGVLVWFAAFSGHWSLFPTSSVFEEFKEELKAYSTSRGTIRFPLGKPPPIDLIRRIVKARVIQNEEKKRG